MNILLILGLSALFHTLSVKNNTVRKELPITLMISSAFAIMLSDNLFDKSGINSFTRGDGLVLILFFGVFLYYLISISRNKIEEDINKEYPSMKKSIILTVLGLAGIILGSNIFNIGIVIGLPIVLIGGIVEINFSYIDLIVMILSALLLFIFSFKDRKISKKEGIIFLLIFIIYYSYVIFV